VGALRQGRHKVLFANPAIGRLQRERSIEIKLGVGRRRARGYRLESKYAVPSVPEHASEKQKISPQ
jgi:hypothetical protein